MASPVVATYSIAACDLAAGQWGVAVQSKFLAVGSVVPWAAPGVGAVATQAWANPRYGPDGLELLAQGLSAEEVVARLTEADEARETRQLGVVDAHGRGATFTGSECNDWAGGRTGPCYAAQGNILVSAETVDALAETFEATTPAPARRAAARLPRGRAGGGRRPARAAVRRAPRRRAGRRLRSPLGRPRRPARRRPPAPDRGAAAPLRRAPGALRHDAARRAGCRSRASSPPRCGRASPRSATSGSPTGPASRTSRSASTARTRSTRSCSSTCEELTQ